jgi:hypothetical protein
MVSKLIAIAFILVLCVLPRAVHAHGGESHGGSVPVMTTQGTSKSANGGNFSLGLDVSFTKGLNESSGESKQAHDAPSGPPVSDSVVNASGAYWISRDWGLGLSLGYANSSGTQDPGFGPIYKITFDKRWIMTTTLAIAAPLSETSRTQDRILTTNVTSGAAFTEGRWSANGYLLASFPAYGNGKAHPASAPDTGKANGSGIDPNLISSMSGGDEHDDDSPQKMQVGTSLKMDYRLNRSTKLGVGYDLAWIDRYYSPATYLSELTVAKAKYLSPGYEIGFGFGLRDEKRELKAPTQALVRLGITLYI